jgi:hypothetical protein
MLYIIAEKLRIYYKEDAMTRLIKKNEAAKYMKISVATLNKFLKCHKSFAGDNNMVDKNTLDEWIEKESGLAPDNKES